MKEHREGKSHEVEMIVARLEQSTHHQQLLQVQQLQDTISKGCSSA